MDKGEDGSALIQWPTRKSVLEDRALPREVQEAVCETQTHWILDHASKLNHIKEPGDPISAVS